MVRTKMISRTAGALALGAASLVPGPGLAAAGARPALAAPPLELSTTDLAIGTDLIVSGAGCVDDRGSAADHVVVIGLADPDQPEQFEVPPFILGETAVDADGAWSIAIEVAQPLPPGRWLMVAGCLDIGGTRSLEFAYDPAEVTNTPPPVTGIVLDRDTISIDNPCRTQASAPPFQPEISAVLRSPATPRVDDVGLEAATTVPAGSSRASFRVPSSVPSGSYLLQVDCLAHRVTLPLAIFASTVDWVAAPSSRATSTTSVAGPGPGPATPAPAVEGNPAYTG